MPCPDDFLTLLSVTVLLIHSSPLASQSGIVGNISTGKMGTGKGGNFPWKGKMGQILFQWGNFSSGKISSGSR
jgi:hypothetical protein